MFLFSKSDILPLRILKVLLALCLATPLLAFSGVIFPYTVPKVFAFRILVELAAIFYLYLALKYPANFCAKIICHPERSEGSNIDSSSRHSGTQNDKKGSWWPARHASWFASVAGAVSFFLLISFLSALFGADFYTSFWGNLERGGGVFGLLHFAAWFFMLSSVLNVDGAIKETKESEITRSREQRGRRAALRCGGRAPLRDGFLYQLIKVSIFTSTLISFLAILQHFFSLGNLLPQADRVYSLIGNAGILGSYLIFNIFLAGYLALSEFVILSSAKTGRRIYFSLYSLFVILNSFALLLSGTRGAWLGLLAGIVIFLVLIAWQPQQKKQRKITVWILVIIFILATSLFFIRNSFFAQNNSVLSRLTSISLNDSTIQSRLILWQSAWQTWQKKSLLGWGPENFETAITKHLSSRLANFEAYSTDRAHNFIFDYGVTIGWLGLLSYLVIFFAAGRFLIKIIQPLTFPLKDPLKDSYRIKNNFYFPAIFLSLLTAYLIQNLFIFDSFVSYLMLFFVLALISSACHPDSAVAREESSRNIKLGFRHLSLFVSCFLFLVSFLLLFVIYSYNLKPFLAANYANQILSLPASEAAQTTLLLKNALALNSFASPEIAYQTVIDYIDKISQNPALVQNEEFYGIASAELSKIIARSPNQSRNYIALSWLNLYFSGQQSARLGQSINLAQKVRELSPNKKDAYLPLVAGYTLSGQSQKALAVVDEALAIDAKMGEEVRAYFEKLK